MTSKITVLGSAGSVGVELANIVKNHEFKDQITFADSISSLGDNAWAEAVAAYLAQNDVLVLCLPDQVARDVVAIKAKTQNTCRILDASSTHRTQPGWIYGLPEIPGRTEEIKKAKLVSNPGCHATGAILSVKPLMAYGLAQPTSPLSVQSLTGYSGGGKSLINKYESETQPTVLDYSIGAEHKHVPEIKAQTGINQLSFTPTVVNEFRGMRTLSTIPLTQDLSTEELGNAFKQYYQDAGQVQVLGQNQINNAWNLGAEKDSVQLTVTVQDQIATVLAHYDNLRKGAAGALLQNLTLMTS